MTGFDIPFRQNRIHGFSAGAGDPLVLCFHGFGEDCHSFDCLAPGPGENYCLAAIDLPGHGETIWKDPRFTPKDLSDLIRLILKKFNKEKIILLGNSLGARFALCAEEVVPELFSSLVLLAPDGLKDNFWYRMATGRGWSNRLFYFLMQHPSLLFGILRAGTKTRLFNPSELKFFNLNLDTSEKRERVYRIWTSMMTMNPRVEVVKKLMNTKNTPLVLVYGKFDRVSPYQRGEKIFRHQPGYRLVLLEKGHHLLSSETTNEIKKAIGL